MVLSSILFFWVFSFQGADLFGDEYLDRAVKDFLQENPDIPPADIAPLGQKALPLLMKKLEDEKSPVMNRLRAAELLLFLGGDAKEKGMTRLIQALDDSDSKVRIAAVEVLVNVDPDDKRVFNAVYQKLDDPDPSVRRRIIDKMALHGREGGLYLEKILPKLKKMLVEDSDAGVRMIAAGVMGWRGFDEKKDESVPALQKALRDDSNVGVRKMAIEVLWSLAVDDRETLEVIFDRLQHDSDGIVREKATRIFLNFRSKSKKLTDPYFRELLRKAITSSGDEREHALKAISSIGFPRNFISFLSEIGVFQGPAAGVANRRKTELRLSLEKQTLLARHPELSGLLEELTKDYSERREESAREIVNLREKLTPGEDEELRDLLGKGFVKKTTESVCVLLCRLYANSHAWFLGDHEKFSSSLHFAMTSLRSLFFLKAAHFCPKEVPAFIRVTSGRKEIALPLCDEDTFQEIKEFSSKFIVWSYPSVSYDVYGRLFYLLLLQELRRSETDRGKKKEIAQEIEKIKNRLDLDIDHAENLSESREGGSLFHSPLLSASVLAVPTQRGEELVAQTIDPQDPLRIKYSLIEPLPHPKASIGRAVQANLVMYKSDPRNTTFRKNLMSALSFYRDQFPFLMLHLKTKPAFLWPHLGPYKLASYYLYTSVPYATAAINLLLQDADDEEEEELIRMKDDLKEMLLSLINEDGSFHSDFFLPGYENAMGGLALLPLAEEECQPNKKRPSLGILTEE